MEGVIRLGDSLSAGGCVTEAGGEMFDGKPVMLMGDKARCSQHGETVAVEGHPAWTINGRNVVIDRCKAACGCLLLSSLPEAGVR
ncbi:PAAR domain-containing protein [Candidatus Pantoea formicae]|uniref:PAAR domain-containing protein n=1 Tax=Candidatus Pantoea formicae TaxID=2608355 RepID=UPI003ED8B48C